MKKNFCAWVTVLVLSWMLSAVHAEALTPRIVGGFDAAPGAWPWMVALVKAGSSSNFSGQFCGGSLISQQWVLTAAHCVDDRKASDFKAVLGLYNLKTDRGTVATIKQIKPHPNWNTTTFDSDLALLELATPVNFPIVTLSTQKATTGENAIAIGWGSTEPTGTIYPSVLQQVTLPIVSSATCSQTYPGQFSPTMLCAGFRQGGKDTCLGDSGGPLVIMRNGGYIQTGVASFGNGCAQANAYGIYSDLSNPSLQQFIKETTTPSGGTTDTVLAVEEPSTNSTYSGVANLRGWAVSINGIDRIELLVDGTFFSAIPQGGLRQDVGNAFPTYPGSANSGFSMTFNYSSLANGQHAFTIRAIDNRGNIKAQTIAFFTVHFDIPGNFLSDPTKVNLRGATLSIGQNGRSISIRNMLVDNKAYTVFLDWSTGSQGFSITKITGP